MSDEEIAAWVQRQMEGAPERDEAWSESVMATYLGEAKSVKGVAA